MQLTTQFPDSAGYSSNFLDIVSPQTPLREKQFFAFTLLLLLFPFLCCLFSVIGLLVQVRISVLHSPLAFFFTILGLVLVCRLAIKDLLVPCIMGITVLFVLILLSSFFWDYFFDSVWYHYPAQAALSQGWNPLYEPDIQAWNLNWKYVVAENDANGALWINFYPKAQWYIGSTIYALFPKLESANFTHCLYTILAFLVFHDFLKATSDISYYWKILLSIIAAFNPISIVQWQTAYVDGLFASLFTIAFFSVLAYIQSKQKKFIAYFIVSAPLLLNIKTTGVIYGFACFIGLLLLVVFYHRDRLASYLKISFVSMVLALFIGINPYITNVINQRNPIYPIFSFDRNDTTYTAAKKGFINNTPDYFKNRTSIVNFVVSHLIADTSIWQIRHFKKNVNFESVMYDTRVGGFGPFFRYALMLTLIGIDFIRNRCRQIVFASILLSILINPHSWWARYVPQLWLLPVLFSLFLFMEKRKNIFLQNINYLIILIMLINVVGIFTSQARVTLFQTQRSTSNSLTNSLYIYDRLISAITKGYTRSNRYYYCGPPQLYISERERIHDFFGAPLEQLSEINSNHQPLLFEVYVPGMPVMDFNGNRTASYGNRFNLFFVQVAQYFLTVLKT